MSQFGHVNRLHSKTPMETKVETDIAARLHFRLQVGDLKTAAYQRVKLCVSICLHPSGDARRPVSIVSTTLRWRQMETPWRWI